MGKLATKISLLFNDAPARQAFVTELIEKRDDLANAIAVNSTMFNGARLIGPAIGGLLLARVSAAYCFLIDGVWNYLYSRFNLFC